MINNPNTNPENTIDNTVEKARGTYKYNGANYNLTDEQKATFKPYTVETVEDVIMIMAMALKENNSALLVEIHDRLMVSNIELAYDILIVMIRLRDEQSVDMYMDFVPYTELSQIDSKGIYRRCLGSIGFYEMTTTFNGGKPGNVGYLNPVLGLEYYPQFGSGVIDIVNADNRITVTEKYRKYISEKYADLIEKLLTV